MRKCCMKGCTANGETLQRFPSPKNEIELFKRCLHILGMSDLLNSQTPEQIYKNKRVCFAHFDPSCKSPDDPILQRYSIPAIGIPVPEGPAIQNPLPSSSCDTLVIEKDSGIVKLEIPIGIDENKETVSKPSTSMENELTEELTKSISNSAAATSTVITLEPSVKYKKFTFLLLF